MSTRAAELGLTGWPVEQQRAFLVQQHRLQDHSYRAAYPDAEWLIVEQGGAAIGRLYIAERSQDVRIIDVSLVAEKRGQGIGRAILTDLIDSAHEAGKSVTLHVEIQNPALRLYAGLGFRTVEDKGAYLLLECAPPPR